MNSDFPSNTSPAAAAASSGRPRRPARPARPAPAATPPESPVAALLAQQFPHLFGERPLPLKRGILADLSEALGEAVSAADLKGFLGQHTRSTRYLRAMANGLPRHDLAGAPVEALAADHRLHAVLVVHQREARRPQPGAVPQAWRRLTERLLDCLHTCPDAETTLQAQSPGASPDAQQAIAEALDLWRQQRARVAALLRAFQASGLTLDQFCSDYGLDAQASAALASLVPPNPATP